MSEVAGAASTPDETRARLDRELEASLEKYDSALVREQAAVADRQRETAIETAAREDRAADPGTQGPPPSAAGAGKAGGGAPSADVPRGDDDDVVARQLREAAESEQDPALREKLWQEYRDYKAGVRRTVQQEPAPEAPASPPAPEGEAEPGPEPEDDAASDEDGE